VWLYPIHRARKEALEKLDVENSPILALRPELESITTSEPDGGSREFLLENVKLRILHTYSLTDRSIHTYRSRDGETSVDCVDLINQFLSGPMASEDAGILIDLFPPFRTSACADRKRALSLAPKDLSRARSVEEVGDLATGLQWKKLLAQVNTSNLQVRFWSSATHEAIVYGDERKARLECSSIGFDSFITIYFDSRNEKALEHAREIFSVLGVP